MNLFHPLSIQERRILATRDIATLESFGHHRRRRTFWIWLKKLFRRIKLTSRSNPLRTSNGNTLSVPQAEGEENWNAEAIEILAVGTDVWEKPIQDALLAGPSFRLCSTTDLRTLWLTPIQQSVHVIVLHDSLSQTELESVSRLARRSWPSAGILVIRAGEDFLEDALYDERIFPTACSDTLVAPIERLAGKDRNARSNHGGR